MNIAGHRFDLSKYSAPSTHPSCLPHLSAPLYTPLLQTSMEAEMGLLCEGTNSSLGHQQAICGYKHGKNLKHILKLNNWKKTHITSLQDDKSFQEMQLNFGGSYSQFLSVQVT